MTTVIKVEDLSKKYVLNHLNQGERYIALRDVITHSVKNLFRAEQKIAPNQEEFWALRNLSFEIKQGDRVGIIGRNGAGKSTLLKVLSRIIAPTSGQVKIKGRVASLLEVGTGFHPELTGRENIFLNGAILGMKKHEIKRKFDEIVAFAEVEKFLDTPVKRYSSGMYVRLAFSVAAHLEPEILIVDEVLAVGDVQFQKKCMGRMEEVGREGRTILFVSHQMGAIEKLCNTAIFLNQGELSLHTTKVLEAIHTYSTVSDGPKDSSLSTYTSEYFTPTGFFVGDLEGNRVSCIGNNEAAYIYIEGNIEKIEPGLQIGFSLFNESRQELFWSYHTDLDEAEWPRLEKGKNSMRVALPTNLLNEGRYTVELGVAVYCSFWVFQPGNNSPVVDFEISGGLSESIYWNSKRPGIFAPVLDWKRLD